MIPDGVTNIDEDAFGNRKNLESVVIPKSVTSIGAGAFKNCSSLTSIHISRNVTEIDETAFFDCSNLSIHAPAGSCAEQFTEEWGFKFRAE